MKAQLIPRGLGNHDNLHFEFKLSENKINFISIKLTTFTLSGDSYIYKISSKIPLKYLNLDEIFKEISSKLIKYDFNLVVLNRLKFENTEELLEYIKCIELCKKNYHKN